MTPTLLAVMLAALPPAGAEPALEREARLGVIAEAIVLETERVPAGWQWGRLELQALVLATTYEESQRWHPAVHAGTRTGDGGRAVCLAQVHRHPKWAPSADWRAAAGTGLDATRTCVRIAVRVLEHYSATCVSGWRKMDLGGALARVAAGYGTGRTCDASSRPWARARARRALLFLAAMRGTDREVR